jgi:hypothetical protein
MIKYLSLFLLSFSLIFSSSISIANHCSGGHKEIKDTKDSSEEDTKESKSN